VRWTGFTRSKTVTHQQQLTVICQALYNALFANIDSPYKGNKQRRCADMDLRAEI